jgi:HAD superfamily hydrolase (TIGR01484 family)
MTAQHDVRLFLADVDGALVTQDKVLTEAAKAAVQELDQAGIAFAITSGRPPRGMSMLIKPLGLRTAIAGFNGGVLVNPDLSVIESHTLNLAAAKQALKLILDQGLDAWVYTEDEWLIREREAPHVARETWTVKFDAKVVASFTDAHLAHAVKIVGISDDLDLVAACEKVVQNTLGEKASAARSWKTRGLLIFVGCVFLFQMANASMLPLAGEAFASKAALSSLIVSAFIMVPQVIVAIIAPWAGRRANTWGRRPLLLVGFAALPIRALVRLDHQSNDSYRRLIT